MSCTQGVGRFELWPQTNTVNGGQAARGSVGGFVARLVPIHGSSGFSPQTDRQFQLAE
jgi:hypothetical protein